MLFPEADFALNKLLTPSELFIIMPLRSVLVYEIGLPPAESGFISDSLSGFMGALQLKNAVLWRFPVW